ncbi:branched-chain amino acid ABC transporter permease [Geodermatophilus sp. DF01-2]|uniref:branched-chain amino acid ABC transporter permease n=1 Tax=Geodermatophilus sp. DF01-2 TaxID=2559610 RepID=UPI001073B3A4|nr:branched-chain amino acid ABC transporter permease [Geodermatophilus sp. DF01_2]TFV61904.1 branched-chain amino acid ABC transporter permease [Geodermatophilus sp. DF01_2]
MADERQALADPESQSAADADLPVAPPERPGARRPWIRSAAVAVGLLVAVAIPLFGPTDSTLLLLANVAMYTALGANWNLISGYTGYIDFGHAVFFGIGGYVTAILITRYDVPLLVTLPIALAFAAVFALLIGVPLLRVRGVYFSIAMLGAFLGTREIAGLLPITGGGVGITIPPWTDPNGRTYFYYAFLAMAVVSIGLLAFVRRSQLGSCLLAVREDEEGAAARGVNTTAVKVAAFVVAGSLTSVVGAVWAYQNTFVDPLILFRDELLLYLALVVLVGGLGTIWGPLVGAVTVVIVRDVLAQNFVQLHLLILGLFLLAVVLLMPEGIVGARRNRLRAPLVRHFRRVTKQLASSMSHGGHR